MDTESDRGQLTNSEKKKSEEFKSFNKNESEDNYEDSSNNQKFKDFLTLPKISGKGSSLSDTNFIASEKIIKREEYVEIADLSINSDKAERGSTILLIKDEKGVVKQIEVLCKCGNISRIDLEYEQ